MSRKQLREATVAADVDREIRQRRLAAAWQPWRQRVQAHRNLLVLGGSFVVGAMMARSPGRLLMRGIGAIAGITSLMLRTPLGSLMIAGVASARSAAPASPASITDAHS